MLNLPAYIIRFWRYVNNSIAFIPGLLVIGFVFFSFFMTYLESKGLSKWLSTEGAFWLINSEDTARTVLTSVIGGLVSLTVFSFSMVMVVLSQATSTLSPRLLPQLIRDRSHQVVLGIYLGVIIFTYLTLINIDPVDGWNIAAFTIFVCVILAIFCLALFVYFISSISQRIQVGRVILTVRSNARKDIDYWKSMPEGWSVAETPTTLNSPEWSSIKARRSGYIDLPIYRRLSKLAAEHEADVFLHGHRSAYILEGNRICSINKKLSEKECQDISELISLSSDDITDLWHVPAIRHITEVAVKAMSPGINDPGTAVESVDMLTDILSGMLELPQFSLYQHPEKGGRLYFQNIDFTTILGLSMQELRCYSKSDPAMMRRLTLALFHLRRKSVSDQVVYAAIDQEIKALEEDGMGYLKNSHDREQFRLLISKLQGRKEEA